METTCDVLCMAQCHDLSFSNKTLEALWTCLTFLCNVTVEDHQRTSFLRYLATNVSADMDASNYSHCITYHAFLFDTVAGYAAPVKGYLSPVIILLTIMHNTLVCIVLLKPHMRSTVNGILVLIALSDTMTWVFALPVYIYFYATERVHEWIPYSWCYTIDLMEYCIPIIFNTASIWLTMTLGIQQYICVCHPFKALTWCTMRRVIYGLSAIYLFATLSEIPTLFEYYIIETRRRSRLNPSVMVSACVRNRRPWFADNYRMYSNIYFGFKLIFMGLIPFVTLIVLNTLLIFTMRKATEIRIQHLRQNMAIEMKQWKETNSTTMMLVTIMVLCLLVWVPMLVYTTIVIFANSLDSFVFIQERLDILILFINLFVQISSPLNFYIYCSMSKKFRNTLKSLLKCHKMP